MKANKVLKILQITRPTLCAYIKSGKITGTKNTNGQWDYDDESVYKLAGIKDQRKTVIYSRVNTNSQDLDEQTQIALDWANKNGYSVDEVYKDIDSGFNLERESFLNLFKQVTKLTIKTIIVTHPNRFTKIGWTIFRNILEEFGCEIISINKVEGKIDDKDNDLKYLNDLL